MAPTIGRPQPRQVLSASGRIQTYGYHNTFHTHALASISESAPPSYEFAISSKRRLRSSKSAPSLSASEPLPKYDCTVHFKGFLAFKTELSTPFRESPDKRWHSRYAVLCGTQLTIFRSKPSRAFTSGSPTKGRLVRTYSLQHAEIGLAVDYNGCEIVPKSLFAKIMPKAARKKLWETDPQFFEPSREYVMRLRVEEETVLLCTSTHENMLDWLELLGAAIDISQPLDDRSEPRYRSLPRRSRRQRHLEASALERTSPGTNEELEARLIAQQQRLFRRLYPRLADDSAPAGDNLERTVTSASEVRREAALDDAEDLDPADVRVDSGEGSSSRPNTAQGQNSSASLRGTASYEPKTAPEGASMSTNALCRFRRRCAPILLASSARASPVIYHHGQRYRIDCRRDDLVPFQLLPPRYDALKEPIKPTTASALDDRDMISRSTLDGGVTTATFARGNRCWRSGAAEVWEEHADHDGTSLHSTATTGGELSRIGTTAEEAGSAARAKGKGKALFLCVQIHDARQELAGRE